MDINLSELFKEVCKEIGCQESDALPSLKILNENFFFKLKDLKNLNLELWRILNLPLNLFFILQEKIKFYESYQISIPQINPIVPEIKKEKIESKITIPAQEKIESKDSKIIIDVPVIEPKDKLKNDIFKILDSLKSEINDSNLSLEIFKKLHTIIFNITSNKNDEKYRKLKVDSKFYQNTIQPYKNTLRFLETIQFVRTSLNYLEYVGDLAYVIQVEDLFNEFLIDRSKYTFYILEIAQKSSSSFDPYSSHIITTSGPAQVDFQKVEQTDFDELIRKEKERREVK